MADTQTQTAQTEPTPRRATALEYEMLRDLGRKALDTAHSAILDTAGLADVVIAPGAGESVRLTVLAALIDRSADVVVDRERMLQRLQPFGLDVSGIALDAPDAREKVDAALQQAFGREPSKQSMALSGECNRIRTEARVFLALCLAYGDPEDAQAAYAKLYGAPYATKAKFATP